MLRFDPQVSVGEPEIDTIILVSTRINSKPLRLKGHSVALARRLVVGCDAHELIEDLQRLTGSPLPLEGTVAAFVAQLRGAGMIEGDLPPLPSRSPADVRRVRLPNPDGLVIRPGEWLGRLPCMVHAVTWAALAIASMMLLAIAAADHVLPSVFVLRFPAGLLGLLMLPGWIVLHESAHALACRAVGCPVSGAGLMLRRFSLPTFYVDTRGLYLLPGRWPKVLVALVGPVVDLTCSGALAAILVWGRLGPTATAATQVALYCVLLGLFFNLSPFRRSDGSNALAAALGDPLLPLRAFSRTAGPVRDGSALRIYRLVSAAYGLLALLLLTFVFQVTYAALKPKVEAFMANDHATACAAEPGA